MTRSPAPPAPATAAPVQRRVALLERIAAASASFGNLTKDSKNDYLKSSYLGLPGLLKAIKQPLLEQGVMVYTQITKAADGSFVIRTTLSEVAGEEEISSDFPVFDVSTMHKIGAAVTYGTRYNLLALLAVCPDSDDDGSSAVYGAQSAAPTALPGLPGGVIPVQMPPFGTPPVQQAPVAAQMVPAPAVAYPVQPSPVLQQ
jgi:hypothetical protein